MITTRQIHLELEFFRWLLLVLAAIALVLATAVLAAADPRVAPQLGSSAMLVNCRSS